METNKKDNLKKYDLDYKKKNYQVYAFRLNKVKDKDIIEKLSNIKDKTEYFRKLIRENG